MLECFRWLLFLGGSAITAGGVWWGVQLGLRRSDEEIRRDYESLSKADLRRYVVHISKGLVEFQETLQSRFEFFQEPVHSRFEFALFIHESAREFIVDKEGEVLKMFGVRTRDDLEAQSYQRLRDSYFNEVVARQPQLLKAVEIEGRAGITDAVLEQMGWKSWKEDGTKPLFPIAGLAALIMMEMAENAYRCGVDQTDFLETLSLRAGLYLLELVYEKYVVLSSLIGLLLYANCPALIRNTQREAVRRALQSRQPFGLVDGSSRKSPVGFALYWDRREGIDAIVELYLQSETRHPQLQQILQQLADTWNPAVAVDSDHEFGPLLDVADRAPRLATFFLVTLAVPQKLEPHLDYLQQLVARSSSRLKSPLTFLHTLCLFVEERLPSAAIDVMHPNTIRWLEETQREEDKDERLERYGRRRTRRKQQVRKEMREKREEKKAIRQHIAALLKARRSRRPLPSG